MNVSPPQENLCMACFHYIRKTLWNFNLKLEQRYKIILSNTFQSFILLLWRFINSQYGIAEIRTINDYHEC